MSANDPLLEVSGITKTYPGVVANDSVSFSVGHGEIHALLGENGAGKSTLVKIIYGVARPDAGGMHLASASYAPSKPSEARAHGVGMVFQHFSLFEALTVAENVALGMEKNAAAGDLERNIVEVSNAYGLPLDPDRLVGSLSVGERQRVEIVRCLLQNPRLLIMDEPTSVLTPQEVEVLFRTLRTLADEGCSILYISHKLEEIRSLCERATVLRGGKVVATCDPREETARSLAEMMIGESLRTPSAAGGDAGATRLTVRDLSLPADGPFGVALENVGFDVRAGEILGIAGVAGNGQDELLEALSGEVPCPAADAIRFKGEAIGRSGPRRRRALGIAVVPEERLGHAAVPTMSLEENALLTGFGPKGLVSAGMIRSGPTRDYAASVIKSFDVRTSGSDAAAASLSGGNLQKFVVGREILQDPVVLIAAQPTWGVDAGAAGAIRRALRRLAEQGGAVVVISQDLDELMEISDRIAVINVGRLSEPRPTRSVTVEEIGLLMGGVHGAVATPELSEAAQ